MFVFQFRDRTYALDTHGTLSVKEETEAVAVLRGLSAKQSAQERGISPDTAKKQRDAAKSKVAARSLPEFCMAIVASGWLMSWAFLIGRISNMLVRGARSRTPASRPTPAPLSLAQLTPAQRKHALRLDAVNQSRYCRFLAALRGRGCESC